MKKNFNYYIGINVSKLTLDVCILRECENGTAQVHYKIENSEKSIAQFLKKKFGSAPADRLLFCFEDTGIYSFPLACYLHENSLIYCRIPAVEIKRSKGITRGKDDKTDAEDIAFYAFSNTHKLRPSAIPATSIQQLKLLVAEREKILKALSMFERTNENKGFIAKEVFETVADMNSSITRCLKKNLKKIEAEMMEIIASQEQLSQQYKLVTSIPGVGMQTAVYLLIATKGFEAFENWRQLACYAGVAPFPYQSGTSIRGRTKVHPLADKKLKSLLNMCAMVAVRHDHELKAYYERKTAEGKAKMLVLNNVRAKLLARVFAVINRKTPFVDTRKFAA